MAIRGLCKLPDGRDWLWGELGLALMGRVTLSKSLIQFSANGWGYARSLRQPSPGLCSLWARAISSKDRANGRKPPPSGCKPHTTPPGTAAARAPAPVGGHCWPMPLQETLKHSQAGLAQCLVGSLLLSLGPGVDKFCLYPPRASWLSPSYHLIVASPLSLDMGYLFFGGFQHPAVNSLVQPLVAILVFSQEKMSSHPSTLPFI